MAKFCLVIRDSSQVMCNWKKLDALQRKIHLLYDSLILGDLQIISLCALTFGSPFSAMALSHWMTLSVCLK